MKLYTNSAPLMFILRPHFKFLHLTITIMWTHIGSDSRDTSGHVNVVGY
jgi:hypothetical protein